jgi:hypothetical protein
MRIKAAVMEGSRYLATLNAAFGTMDIDLNRVSARSRRGAASDAGFKASFRRDNER